MARYAKDLATFESSENCVRVKYAANYHLSAKAGSQRASDSWWRANLSLTHLFTRRLPLNLLQISHSSLLARSTGIISSKRHLVISGKYKVKVVQCHRALLTSDRSESRIEVFADVMIEYSARYVILLSDMLPLDNTKTLQIC